MKLLERNIVPKILGFINTSDVLVIHGARQVGKSSLMKYIQNRLDEDGKNTFYADLEDFRHLELFDGGPSEVVKYLEETGRLGKKLWLFVDEIQYLKNPSNFLKLARDHYSDRLKLIVSGSSSFEIKSKFKETLVGRTVNFELYPLDFAEFLRFKNRKYDIGKTELSEASARELQKLWTEFTVCGGYPRIVLAKTLREKETYLGQIIDTYVRKDIRDIAGIRDISKFNRLIEILSSQSGKLLNVLELSNTAGISRPAVENYLFILENTYVIKLLRPFAGNLRSELFKTPKLYFCDTGISNLLHYKTFPKILTGENFETAVFMEFVKNKSGREVYYWRTQDGKEIDFILKKGPKILPVEAKLSSGNFKTTAVKFFAQRYGVRKSYVLAADAGSAKKSGVIFKHPWSAAGIF